MGKQESTQERTKAIAHARHLNFFKYLLIMPIIVNIPGGGLDTAGRGMAAGQQYRANEQQMQQVEQEARLRSEKFQFEKQAALRSMQLDEENARLRREELAQGQEAEADAILGLAIENGMDVGDQGAYREMLARTSPQFRTQMARDLAMASRQKQEQAQIQETFAKLSAIGGPEAEEIIARVESGEITPTTARREAQRLSRSETNLRLRTIEREDVFKNLEAWRADPQFDMPDEDDDAYDDVVDLMEKLNPNLDVDPKTNYSKLLSQFKFLTNRSMREAGRELLKKQLQTKDLVVVDRALLESAASSQFQERVQDDVYATSRDQNLSEEGAKAYRERAFAEGIPGPGHGKVVMTKPDGKPASSEAGSGKNVSLSPSMTKSDAPPKYQPETVKLVGEALKEMGLTEQPEKGTPEHKAFIAKLTAKLEAARKKKDQEPKAPKSLSVDDYQGATFTQ